MKNNKKGFTLIELLAVIVILAIIALIAVPTIMGIINKANKSAFKDTAYGIISAGELYFAEQQLELNGMQEDKTFDLTTDVNVEGGLQLKGEVPKTGTLIVNTEGKIALALDNDRYCITKRPEDNDITVTEEFEECRLPGNPNIISVSNNCARYGVCTKDKIKSAEGVKVKVQVNENQSYDFYVLSNTAEELTLIMSEPLTASWWATVEDYTAAGGTLTTSEEQDYSKNDLGPITALKKLNSQTSTWEYIDPITNYTYDNNLNGSSKANGYRQLKIIEGLSMLVSQDGTKTTTIEGVGRARLLTFEEATSDAIGCLPSAGSCPIWLYENSGTYKQGQYTLSTYGSKSTGVFYIRLNGSVGGAYPDDPRDIGNDDAYCLRPVITISK